MTTISGHTTRATGTILTASIYNNDHTNHITNANALNSGKIEAAVGPVGDGNIVLFDGTDGNTSRDSGVGIPAGGFADAAELASTANGEGASLIGVRDAAGNFAGANVEAVLAEIISDYAAASSGNGASKIGVEDAAGNFADNNVEDVLADLASRAAAVPQILGLIITNNSGTPTTSVDIDADDALILNSSGIGVRLGAVNLTVACAGTGANGLDAGSLANNTWYHLYIIYNPTTDTIAGLASTSATAPTLPSGYTFSYRVGAIRTGGSATFVRIRQVGNRAQYVVVTSSTTPNLPIMQSGNSGSPTTPTWTAVSVSSYVPPTATSIKVVLKSISNDDDPIMAAPNNSYGAYNSSANPPPLTLYCVAGTITLAVIGEMALESSNIYYAASGNNTQLMAAMGWTDAVNAC